MFCQNFHKKVSLPGRLANLFRLPLWIYCSLLFIPRLFAQDAYELKYISQIAAARSDSDKVIALSRLADYYFVQDEHAKGDSILQQQIMLSEESRNENLISYSLFYNARFQYVESFSKDKIDKSLALAERALNYSKLKGLDEYAALAYSKLAEIYTIKGQLDMAFRNASTAFATALHTTNDSIKTISTLEWGDVYLSQGEVLMAFKTYTNAYDYANNMHNPYLLSKTYLSMSRLFKKLGDYETAKDYALKSLEVNRINKNIEGMLEDYLVFGQLHEYQTGITYLTRAVNLSDSVNNLRYKYRAEKLIFIQKMVNSDPSETLSYLASHPQIAKSYNSKGPGNLDWAIADVFLYRNLPDSAIKYFLKAQPDMSKGSDAGTKLAFNLELASCYDKLNKLPEAIQYYKEALSYAELTSDLYFQRQLASALKNCYEKQGDFQSAFVYDKLFDRYSDSANILAKDKDLALLQIDNENKRRLREAEIAAAKERRRHDLQYMGITIAIGLAFILLLTLGMFTVSKITIRIMAFFSFILLFEFIILVLDNYIHHLTHGEPLKIWGIKIVLISMLFPLHHFMEDKLIHYLVSRKLITLRSRFSLKRLIFGEKKPVVKEEPQAEVQGVKEVIAE